MNNQNPDQRHANQRYYSSTIGRFTRPDPFGGSAEAGSSQSWNRYAYAGNDPANNNDPAGLCDADFAGITMARADSPDFDAYSSGDIAVYPYSQGSDRSSLFQSAFGSVNGIVEVASQTFGPTSNTLAAIAGLAAAAQDGKPINVTAFSGGATAFTAAVNYLNSIGATNITGLINNVTYISPGQQAHCIQIETPPCYWGAALLTLAQP